MREGLRIRGARGHPEVRLALIKYARWLRKNYEFPIRVPVYLLSGEKVIMQDGKSATASFFAPYERNVEPYIRISTGDYQALKKAKGRDDALTAFILSLSHEIIHYFQWVKTGKVNEQGVVVKARKMLHEYSSQTAHP